ncbi:MAG: hypothetical protein Q7R96_06480 [Nanoarchaeota archaeon]|nr:hypothetical protein [Nanoarchaeota archaeon]
MLNKAAVWMQRKIDGFRSWVDCAVRLREYDHQKLPMCSVAKYGVLEDGLLKADFFDLLYVEGAITASLPRHYIPRVRIVGDDVLTLLDVKVSGHATSMPVYIGPRYVLLADDVAIARRGVPKIQALCTVGNLDSLMNIALEPADMHVQNRLYAHSHRYLHVHRLFVPDIFDEERQNFEKLVVREPTWRVLNRSSS